MLPTVGSYEFFKGALQLLTTVSQRSAPQQLQDVPSGHQLLSASCCSLGHRAVFSEEDAVGTSYVEGLGLIYILSISSIFAYAPRLQQSLRTCVGIIYALQPFAIRICLRDFVSQGHVFFFILSRESGTMMPQKVLGSHLGFLGLGVPQKRKICLSGAREYRGRI